MGVPVELPAPRGKLNETDAKILFIHAIVALAQTWLIGAKVEYPLYAPFIQTLTALLAHLAY